MGRSKKQRKRSKAQKASSSTSKNTTSSAQAATDAIRAALPKTVAPTTASDERIDELLRLHMATIMSHTEACSRYARKHFQMVGKGAVTWLMRSVGEADGSSMEPRLAITYTTAKKAQAIEYAPVVNLIEEYQPALEFVALVAIRTNDSRDALMLSAKVNSALRYSLDAVRAPQVKLPALTFDMSQLDAGAKGSSGSTAASPEKISVTVERGCRLCSEVRCCKAETKAAKFAVVCEGCNLAAYDSEECRAKHWKNGHQHSCAALKVVGDMHDKFKAAQLKALRAGATGSSSSAGAAGGAGGGAGAGAGATVDAGTEAAVAGVDTDAAATADAEAAATADIEAAATADTEAAATADTEAAATADTEAAATADTEAAATATPTETTAADAST